MCSPITMQVWQLLREAYELVELRLLPLRVEVRVVEVLARVHPPLRATQAVYPFGPSIIRRR